MRQQFEYHPLIGYRYIAGLRARVPHESGGYLLHTNAQGFRCEHDFVPELRPGKPRRVLLFGDSFTAGDGVRNELRYGDLLEAMLPGLEVYNFGLPGTGTDQQYLCWTACAQGIEHDLVIVAVLVENIRRVASHYRPFVDEAGHRRLLAKPYFELDAGGGLRLCQVPVPREPLDPASLAPAEAGFVEQGGRHAGLRACVNALGLKPLAQRLHAYQPCPEYEDAEHPAWRLLSAILAQWATRVGEHRVLLLPLPLYQHVEQLADASAYRARFEALSEALGWQLHDPLPELLGYGMAARRAFRFEQDVHPSAAGHRALARSLAPVLAARLGLAPSSQGWEP